MSEPVVGRDIPGSPEPESRFTAPTALCPHPERWTSTDGDSTEVEVSVLAYGLVRALQPDLCIETGAGFGQTTRMILDALTVNKRGLLYAIERDHGRAADLRLDFTSHVLRVEESDSLSWEPPTESLIEFAWFDTWYETRVPEFLHLRRWMRAGTIVCFHDTAPEHGSHRIPSGRDLRHEVEWELVHTGYLRAVRLPTPRGLLIAEVTGKEPRPNYAY